MLRTAKMVPTAGLPAQSAWICAGGTDPGIVRPSEDPDEVEIVWRQPGFLDVLWPYELRQYTSSWPADAPDKYQLHVNSDEAESSGPAIEIPSSLNYELSYTEPPSDMRKRRTTGFQLKARAGHCSSTRRAIHLVWSGSDLK